ncbi:MAG: hypothetical protein Q9O24_02230 [Gammaproteobacteria bacterium]|nr:hypothetical protein [Gammaproteobacteria bacterium]
MVKRRRRQSSIPLYRDFLIYVSGAYEKAYMQALHGLLREKWNVNLHCEEYQGGADFYSGIAALKKRFTV